ncbi:hypothetical protein [Synechococcus sp. MU1611]|uniref:hypothetical protein n=1 Tax=Synechococcus sp. MU1611 TaxID=2508345 RepID=UPI001CF87AAE|nr:hypothetical protein [Synechococcus sp. MU1611]MCB4411509.1 hypothetical protein [Synechococcus sp. MU1611]
MGQTKSGDESLKRWGEVLEGINIHKKPDYQNKKRVLARLTARARRRLWAFAILKSLGIHGHNLNLLQSLRPVLALYPTDKELVNETRKYLRRLNRKSLEKFRNSLKGKGNLIIMVVGCIKNEKQLRNTIGRIRQAQTKFSVVGIVGSKNKADWKIKYDNKYGILQLPCSDGYEGLTEKIIWGCLAIELGKGGTTVVKVDEDTKSIDSRKIETLRNQMILEGAKAAGSPISVETPLQIDRGWHLGKSKGKSNWQPYEGIGPKIWMSGGAGYLLMPEAVQTVGDFALHSWQFVKSQIYEDLTISWIVDSCCGKIHWIEQLEKMGIENERSRDIMEGSTYHNPEDLKEDKRK